MRLSLQLGFMHVRETAREVLGSEIADRFNNVRGSDDEYETRSMWWRNGGVVDILDSGSLDEIWQSVDSIQGSWHYRSKLLDSHLRKFRSLITFYIGTSTLYFLFFASLFL